MLESFPYLLDTYKVGSVTGCPGSSRWPVAGSKSRILVVDIINVQLALQRVSHRTHLKVKLDTLTQVNLGLPFTKLEVDFLGQELNDFKVVLCQRWSSSFHVRVTDISCYQ